MIIECNYCEAKVDAKILAQHEEVDPQDEFRYKISFVECPACKRSLIGCQEFVQISSEKWEWDDATRVWPDPKKYLDWSIPGPVQAAIEEANLCYKSKAYNACAVMCGRALECICSEYKTKEKALHGGLKELLKKGIIDKKIFEWSDALRLHRNIGAHATEEKISREDSRDLLDFTNAICDYVFVLSKKFDAFMKRRKK